MKVFIVEDSLVAYENLQSMLSDISGVVIIGHAVDETGAINGIDSLMPDAVILDLNLKSGYGINVLKNIKELHAAIKVIVFTNHANEFYASRCKRAGADYFFDKSFQFSRLRSTLLAISSCMVNTDAAPANAGLGLESNNQGGHIIL